MTSGEPGGDARRGARHARWPLWLLALVLAVGAAAPRSVAQSAPSTRVVAIGDVHGDFDAFVGILQQAGIIDANKRWIAADTTLVQTGDITDRGPKVRAVMDLLMDLEKQAKAARGRVAVLLGNHEVMNLLGDLRYVTPAIYSAFVDERSARRREAAYEAYVRLCQARFAEIGQLVPGFSQPVSKDDWMTAHPPGFVEYREAFSPRGRYGRWLRDKSVVLRIGDAAFLHAGINPARAPRGLDDINRQARAEIRRFDGYHRQLVDARRMLPFFTLSEMLETARFELQIGEAAQNARPGPGPSGGPDPLASPDPLGLKGLLEIDDWSLIHPDGPLWFRGFATWSAGEGALPIAGLLKQYDVARFVVGHTVQDTGRITPRFSGAVFLLDTGMLSSYVPGGVASALEIRDGRFTAIYPNERVPLLEAFEQMAPAGR